MNSFFWSFTLILLPVKCRSLLEGLFLHFSRLHTFSISSSCYSPVCFPTSTSVPYAYGFCCRDDRKPRLSPLEALTQITTKIITMRL